MKLPAARVACLSVSLALLLPATLPAQSSRAGCARSTAIRSVAGGAIGAWLGFVAAKVKVSDWDNASRGAAAHRMKNRYTIGGAVVGLTAGALLRMGSSCGNTPRSAAPPMTATSQALHDPITREEITRSGINGSVYDLVYSLRRSWLNLRGIDALTEGPESFVLGEERIELVGKPRLTAYLNNARLGSIDELRDLPTVGVQSIRYFTGPQATYRWGAGNGHGAIEVLTGTP